MQVIFLGLPGAGKGTQAAYITKDFSIPHIATGDMFRAASLARTELGERVRGFMEAGLLVPDDVTIAVVQDRLSQGDTQNGFLLDGFPRTRPQAEALDDILKDLDRPINHVLYLEVSREELLRRLTGRRICRACGSSYHIVFNPPLVEGICDRCGGELTERQDDHPEAVAKRLEENLERTADLASFYSSRGILTRIDGEKPISHVYDAITLTLKEVSA